MTITSASISKKSAFQSDELNTLLQLGDQEAFSLLYDTYAPALLFSIIRMVKCLTTAENILQTVFIKICSGIRGYSSGKESLFTWMSLIARNETIDFLRTKQAEDFSKTSSTYENKNGSPNAMQSEFTWYGELSCVASSPYWQSVIMELYHRGFTPVEMDQLLFLQNKAGKTEIGIASSPADDL